MVGIPIKKSFSLSEKTILILSEKGEKGKSNKIWDRRLEFLQSGLERVSRKEVMGVREASVVEKFCRSGSITL